MKSDVFKTLIDEQGNKYRFSTTKFRNALEEKKENSKTQKDGKILYKSAIRKAIADRISETMENSTFTEEAVSNWEKGSNGPACMEYVRIAADVLDVHKEELMDRIDVPAETGFTQTEKELVYEVYSKCCRVFLTWADFVPDRKSGLSESKQWEEETKAAEKELWSISRDIYCEHLFIHKEVENRLIKALFDLKQLFTGVTIWEDEIDDSYFWRWDSYCQIPSRKEAIWQYGKDYLYYEMDFADDVGLSPVIELEGDEMLDGEYSSEELEKAGYHGENEITPKMIYEHELPRFLRKVFERLFREAFEG